MFTKFVKWALWNFTAGVKVPVNGSSSVNAKVASTASSNLTSNTPSTTLHTSSTASTATNVNVSSTSNSSAAPATTNNINVNNATKGQATNAAMKFMFIFVFMIRCLKDIGLLWEEGLARQGMKYFPLLDLFCSVPWVPSLRLSRFWSYRAFITSSEACQRL